MLRMTRLPLVLVAALLLTACTGPQSITVESGVRVPEALQSDGVIGESGPGAAWVGGGRDEFVVVLYGSSSCAPIPVDLVADGPRELAVEFAHNSAEVCSADMAANTFAFDTPTGIDAEGDVDLEITFRYDDETSVVMVPVL